MDNLERRVRELEDKVRHLEAALRPKRSRSPSKELRRVHITNIPVSSERLEDRMHRIFGRYGTIVEIQCGARDHWANITFDSADDAEYCFHTFESGTSGMRCMPYKREPHH